jgi:RNA polymerase sigma factor (sigma-70 family)
MDMKKIAFILAAIGIAFTEAFPAFAADKPTDPQIAHIAYTAGLIDIEAGKQAIDKAQNKDVRAVAQRMIGDHTAVNDQALALVKKLNVTRRQSDQPEADKSAEGRAQSSPGSMTPRSTRLCRQRSGVAETVRDALSQTLIQSAQTPAGAAGGLSVPGASASRRCETASVNARLPMAETALYYEHASDLELCRLIVRRDRQAVRLVTRRNNQRLYRAAWSVLKNRAEAEEAVQDGYLKAFAAIGSFDGRSSLSTWLTRIVVNEALGRRRTTQRRARLLQAHDVTDIADYRESAMAGAERPGDASPRTPEAGARADRETAQRAIGELPRCSRCSCCAVGLSVEDG